MKIAFIGDIHGSFRSLDYCTDMAYDSGASYAIQVGDFGLRPFAAKGSPYEIPQHWKSRLPLLFIDGNHDDHKALQSDDYRQSFEQHNIRYQPRGSVCTLGSVPVGYIGGALNVDRPQEWGPRDKHWSHCDWSNFCNDRDIEKCVQNFNEHKPRIIVSHSAPTGVGAGMVGEPQYEALIDRHITARGFIPCDPRDAGELALGQLWRCLDRKPEHWIFGHFHESSSITRTHLGPAPTTFTCVNASYIYFLEVE